MKRFLSLLLSLVLTLSLGSHAFAASVSPSLANFTKVNEYVSGQFSDFPADIWYAVNIKTAYELGLMKGSSASVFNPAGALTIAETVALACRIHSIYSANGAAFTQGSPWYQVYIDYAKNNGIVVPAREATSNATRAEFAAILASAFPTAALSSINSIADGSLPDVPTNSTYAAPIYTLYRAGVLTGNDAYGTFTPDATIDRASAATIATRMSNPALRKTIALTTPPIEVTGLTLNTESVELLTVGDTLQLTATILPENATDKTVT